VRLSNPFSPPRRRERRGLAEIKKRKERVFFPLFSSSLLFFSYLCETSALPAPAAVRTAFSYHRLIEINLFSEDHYEKTA
jgi:hypothetical protein